MKMRWGAYVAHEFAEEDVHEEEEMMSPAFRLFKAFGTAMSVEMYFTIFGVLLKVVFFTQHPLSEKVLQLEEAHHHVDPSTGQSRVVMLKPKGSKRGWAV